MDNKKCYNKGGASIMGRTPNIKFNGELLDKKIKEIEKDSFNQGKVSIYIMGKGRSYYCDCIKNGTIAESVLDRVCTYYEFDKKEFIVTEETVKKDIQEKADTQNYENVIILLQGIDRTLKELLAQQKSTNYLLGELKTSAMNDTKNSKDILGKLENLEKRQQRYGKYN